MIGTEAVARAAPDGRTLLINAPAPFVLVPHLQKLGYDPVASFAPICNLVSFPEAIVVNGASPYARSAISLPPRARSPAR